MESAYVVPLEERVALSNRENFAQMRLEEAYLCNISTLEGLKDRLNALQFPACIHPLGEAMSEFVKTHSLIMLTVPHACQELYEYYLGHSHESFLLDRAMAALRDPDIVDKPQVTLGSSSTLPTLIEWSLRNTEPQDLMAFHFSALAGYCFFASDIVILKELEKFYDLFIE